MIDKNLTQLHQILRNKRNKGQKSENKDNLKKGFDLRSLTF